MITKRQSVFETNSSSSHSITISDTTELLDSITPDKDGNIVLTGGQFGWEIEDYEDALSKANYCAVDVHGNDDYEQMLIDVIKEHTGAKNVIFDFTTDYSQDEDNYSYIDHQSYGTTHEAFSSNETLKAFIFNPNSVLRTDNDNH